MLVKLRYQFANSVTNGTNEFRGVVNGEAQTFKRHDPRKVLKNPATVRTDKPHAFRQVGVDVFQHKEVNVLNFRPRVAFKIVPVCDCTVMLVSPRTKFFRCWVLSGKPILFERQTNFQPHEIVTHAIPKLNEVVKVGFEGFSVCWRHPFSSEQIHDDWTHNGIVNDVFNERGSVLRDSPHEDVNKLLRVWSRSFQRHMLPQSFSPLLLSERTLLACRIRSCISLVPRGRRQVLTTAGDKPRRCQFKIPTRNFSARQEPRPPNLTDNDRSQFFLVWDGNVKAAMFFVPPPTRLPLKWFL